MIDNLEMDITATPTEVRETDMTRVRIRDGIPFCLGVFLIARIGLSILAFATVGTVEPPSTAGSGVEVPATPGVHNIIDGLDRWDAGWFERIARDGYDPNDASAAFFPGYPIAIRGISVVSGFGASGSALLVSNLSLFASLVVLYGLTTREYSLDRARRTVLLTTFFPASFFFFAPYSESLFLLATLLAFWWARGSRPWLGGIAGFVAAMTRSVGILLMPALLVEAVRRPRGQRFRSIIASSTPVLAPVLYAAYWRVRSGDAFQPLHAQDAWYRTLSFPLVTLGHALWLGVEGVTDPRGIYWTADLILVAALLIPLALRWRVIPTPYLVYAVATVVVVLSYPLPERPLLSVPRFLIVLFPIFWCLEHLVPNDRRFVMALAASIGGYAVLAIAFMNWGFVF